MKKILTLIVISIISIASFAQSNSFYFNKNLYQSTFLNPARQPKCKVVIGLPVISSEYIEFKNTGLTYSDLFYKTADVDSFHLDIDKTFDKLNDVNSIFLTDRTSLGSLAFWIRDFHISIDYNLNLNSSFSYPKSIFLLKDGNYFTDGRYVSATNFGVNVSAYTSLDLGLSKEIIPGLTIGGKLKILRGIANFSTNKFMFDWKVATADTSIYDYAFTTSFEFNSTVPINIIYDADGNITSAEMDTNFIPDLQGNPMLARDYMKENKGLGIDLGIVYNLNNKFEFSASLIDFGFIKWKSLPVNIKTDESTFTFSGADIGKYIGDLSVGMSLKDGQKRDSIINLAVADITDTLLSLSNPTVTNNEYKTRLNTKMNFAAAYSPADWATVGFLYNGMFFNQKLYSSYTFSGTLMFWKGWSYTMSYTMFKQSFNNVGMGASYKIGPFQSYIMLDNIAIPMLGARYGISPDKPYDKGLATRWTKSMKYTTIHFGFNLVFGCKDRRDFGLID